MIWNVGRKTWKFFCLFNRFIEVELNLILVIFSNLKFIRRNAWRIIIFLILLHSLSHFRSSFLDFTLRYWLYFLFFLNSLITWQNIIVEMRTKVTINNKTLRPIWICVCVHVLIRWWSSMAKHQRIVKYLLLGFKLMIDYFHLWFVKLWLLSWLWV